MYSSLILNSISKGGIILNQERKKNRGRTIIEIIGPGGSGKSTITQEINKLNIISSRLPDLKVTYKILGGFKGLSFIVLYCIQNKMSIFEFKKVFPAIVRAESVFLFQKYFEENIVLLDEGLIRGLSDRVWHKKSEVDLWMKFKQKMLDKIQKQKWNYGVFFLNTGKDDRIERLTTRVFKAENKEERERLYDKFIKNKDKELKYKPIGIGIVEDLKEIYQKKKHQFFFKEFKNNNNDSLEYVVNNIVIYINNIKQC